MKELDELLNSQDLDLDKVREKLTVLDEAIDNVRNIILNETK